MGFFRLEEKRRTYRRKRDREQRTIKPILNDTGKSGTTRCGPGVGPKY
jgi:hypothetical protein